MIVLKTVVIPANGNSIKRASQLLKMLNNLKEFFDTHFLSTKTESTATPIKTIEFAAAVLMFEISRADSSIDNEERKVIDDALVNHFKLPKIEAEELISLAEKEVDHSVSLHEFTRLINEKLSSEDKVKIVELLWEVAFADAVLDKYEEYFIRKIADLLYVSHKDYIQSKHRASEI